MVSMMFLWKYSAKHKVNKKSLQNSITSYKLINTIYFRHLRIEQARSTTMLGMIQQKEIRKREGKKKGVSITNSGNFSRIDQKFI